MKKKWLISLMIGFIYLGSSAQAIIIDHNCIKLDRIPVAAITKAKQDLHIVYGHASHGSQLTKGMNGLYRWKGQPYAWRKGGGEGYLDIHDYNQNFPYSGGTVVDLGDPDRVAWVQATREYLAKNPQLNVVMWSWCGQVSNARPEHIQQYLDSMSKLESDFPAIKFVYMTGHLDGTGLQGKLHLNNNIIREFCKTKNKILYDFEDIESYDPDGVYYGDKFASDACNYDANGDGVTSETIIHEGHLPIAPDRNWAIDWQEKHERFDWINGGANKETADYYGYYGSASTPGVVDSVRISHSQPINYNMKAYAAWWLWARLAGWDGGGNIDTTLQPPATPSNLVVQTAGNNSARLTWSITTGSNNSASGFEISRGVNSTTFAIIDTVETTTFTDVSLAPGQEYFYRVRAFNRAGVSAYSSTRNFTNTVITADTSGKFVALTTGDSIRYFKGTIAPQADWNKLNFDDHAWEKGATLIGYGDTYTYGTTLSDMLNGYTTVFIRRAFANPFDVVDSVVVEIDYDDGFVAYVNGTEFSKANVPTQPTFQSNAMTDHESGSNKFVYHGTDLNVQIVKGVNVFSFMVLNLGLSSSDFAFTGAITIYGKSGKTEVKKNVDGNFERQKNIVPGHKKQSMLYDLNGRAISKVNQGKNERLPGGIYLEKDLKNSIWLIVK
jgi:hypothetical protein